MSISSQTSLGELAELLGGVCANNPAEELIINGVSLDSRNCRPGSVFVAVKGVSSDGHAFLDEAFNCGAAAAVVQNAEVLGSRPGIIVADSRRAVSALAAFFSAYATRSLLNIGITGTNGKTTVTWLVYHALNSLGIPALRIGTLGAEAGDLIEQEGNLTTPDPVTLHGLFRRAVDAGVKACVMEASSHALDQQRVGSVAFDVAVFTNLTRDHLDYHQTMEHYFRSKLRLFELVGLKSGGARAAVMNIDSKYGRVIRDEFRCFGLNCYSFGSSREARIQLADFSQSLGGSQARLRFEDREYRVHSFLIGRHNGENLAAAFAACVAAGMEPARVAAALEKTPQVPGRLEVVPAEGLGVYVDYAHTPDALKNAILSIKPLARRDIWVVFGCGGDRDRGKRPQMGAVACELADRVVVTSDNPRSEDPQAIIKEILAGAGRVELCEVDRRAAIRSAIARAADGDVILIAGKGHEDYQISGGSRVHFSDVEEARAALAESGRLKQL